ncbi:MAG: triose-phosphate isomerase, partial [bacterium]
MSIPRKKFIAGNFKMNTTSSEVASYLEAFRVATEKVNDVDIVLIPPFTSLAKASEILGGAQKIRLGAQNMSSEAKGAYTGEISASMLRDLFVRYVLVGHSERRRLFGETDEMVRRKLVTALKSELRPILCIGETLEERQSNQEKTVLESQLRAAIEGLSPEEISEIVIAYEPVWAIGTGLTATPEQAQQA